MKEEIRIIINELGTDNETNKYYVYALCDKRNSKPFYIGKGQGERMWQHERNCEEELKSIDNSQISNQEKEELKKTVSEKYKKIKELENNDNVEKIIIKWGLTENEAFMAESALINLLKFQDANALTNIVNGHASDREKTSQIHNTKAMSETDFLNLCCKPSLNFDKDFNNIKCLFINVNNLYPQCLKTHISKQSWAIRESTRGCWHIGKNRTNPEYIFAVYQSRICGIYRFKERKNAFELEDFPSFPIDIREQEKNCIKKIINEGKPTKYAFLSAETKNCIKKFKKQFETKINTTNDEDYYNNWKKKSYFICEDCYDEKLNKMLGCIIQTEKNKSIFVQNPLRYNY